MRISLVIVILYRQRAQVVRLGGLAPARPISSYGLRIAGTLSIIQEVRAQVTHFSMH